MTAAQMKYISIFSGIEAATVAFHPLGWEPLCFSEIEAFPAVVLQRHYPAVPNVGDMTVHDWSQYRGHCDLVVGGPPCQAFSVAGLRGSLDDARGNLSLAYVHAIRAIDPLWSLTENVPGWLSTADNAFGCVLAGLVGASAPLLPPIQCGGRWTDAGVVTGPERTAAWRILDAQYFGLAQRRRRVFVLSVRGTGNFACANALLPVGHSLSGHPAPRREAGKGTTHSVASSIGASGRGFERAGETRGQDPVVAEYIPSRPTGGGGLGTDFDCDGELVSYIPELVGTLNAAAHSNVSGRDAESGHLLVAPSLVSSGDSRRGFHGAGGLVVHSLRGDGFDASEDGTGRGTPLVAVDLQQITSKVNRSTPTPESPPLTTNGTVAVFAIQERAVCENPNAGPDGAGVREELAYTVEARSVPQAVAFATAVRRLSPVECERLMGFPDNYTLVPYRGKPARDGPRYKALGNSMATTVVRWIGTRIAQVDGLMEEGR